MSALVILGLSGTGILIEQIWRTTPRKEIPRYECFFSLFIFYLFDNLLYYNDGSKKHRCSLVFPLFNFNSSDLHPVIGTFPLSLLYVFLIAFFNFIHLSISPNVLRIVFSSIVLNVAFKSIKVTNSSSPSSILLSITYRLSVFLVFRVP